MTALSSGPEPQPTPLLDAAVSYGGRGWKVVPFCWVEDHDDIALCSCGDAECPCPGGHLVEGLTLDDATSAHDEIVTLWSVYPMANIALVTGGTSAVIVAHFAMKLVPPAAHSFLMPLIAQCCAVSLHDGDERLSFFIAAGPEELAPIGHVCAGLRVSAGGELVMLPPSRTPTGRVRWEEEQVTQLARSPWRMASLGELVRGVLGDASQPGEGELGERVESAPTSVEPDVATSPHALRDAALAYAARQWPVIPLHGCNDDGSCKCADGPLCPMPGEHLIDGMTVADATTDPGKILAWWRDAPGANVGVATGALSGLVVLGYHIDTIPPDLRAILDQILIVAPPLVQARGDARVDAYFALDAGGDDAVGGLENGFAVSADGDLVAAPPSRLPGGVLAWNGALPAALPRVPWNVRDLPAVVDDATVLRRRRPEAVRPLPPVSVQRTAPAAVFNTTIASGSMPIVRRMSEVEPEVLQWLWPLYVPYGTLVVFQGHPGGGKSTLAIDLAARVSTGAPMPMSSERTEPCSVLLLAGEDDLGAVVRQRLEAAGGDLERVFTISGMEGRHDDLPRRVSLARDVPAIEAVCREHDVRLVIIDPMMEFVDGVDTNSDPAVRQAFAPLAALAQREGLAVILIRHLVKRGTGLAMHKGSGSIAFAGLARAVVDVTTTPDGPVLRVVKSNLGPFPPPLHFSLAPTATSLGGSVARVEWLGEVEEAPAEARQTAPDKAAEYLAERLAAGPVAMKTLVAEAAPLGIRQRALETAKSALGVVATRAGKASVWALPAPEARKPATARGDCGVAELADDDEDDFDDDFEDEQPRNSAGVHGDGGVAELNRDDAQLDDAEDALEDDGGRNTADRVADDGLAALTAGGAAAVEDDA